MEHITYMTSILTFYIRGKIKLEENMITFKVPNTILGVFPLGYKKDSIAINQIASVSTNFKLNLKAFLLGIVIIVLGLCLLKKAVIWAIILIALGFASIINSMPTNFTLATTSGKEINIKFLMFDAEKANYAREEINMIITKRLDDTNSRIQTNKIIETINDK